MSAVEELEICARIKQARKEAGLSQDEFADLLHVKLRTVQNYEKDRVPWRLLKQIAKITGKSQEWLLRGPEQTQLDRMERRQDYIMELVEWLAGEWERVIAAQAVGKAFGAPDPATRPAAQSPETTPSRKAA